MRISHRPFETWCGEFVRSLNWCAVFALVALCALGDPASGAEADLILHHAKIVTIDDAFSIREAIAVRDGRVLQIGGNDEILKLRGPRTEVVDLAGRTQSANGQRQVGQCRYCQG